MGRRPWGVSAKEFAAVLDELGPNVTQIDLRINSPGGEAMEGVAILNLLRSHPAKVVATVDGLAASAASFIAAGADETIMARNSQLMIHDAWGLCVGNAQDMKDLADALDKLSDNIASIYADKAGGTIEGLAHRDAGRDLVQRGRGSRSRPRQHRRGEDRSRPAGPVRPDHVRARRPHRRTRAVHPEQGRRTRERRSRCHLSGNRRPPRRMSEAEALLAIG
jgi:hypothetical protein